MLSSQHVFDMLSPQHVVDMLSLQIDPKIDPMWCRLEGEKALKTNENRPILKTSLSKEREARSDSRKGKH